MDPGPHLFLGSGSALWLLVLILSNFLRYGTVPALYGTVGTGTISIKIGTVPTYRYLVYLGTYFRSGYLHQRGPSVTSGEPTLRQVQQRSLRERDDLQVPAEQANHPDQPIHSQ